MQGSLGIPIGAIIAYNGDLNKIPSNFKYCDGTNGTPDLRGKTIIGTGVFNDNYGNINYALGNIGGERYHQLSILEMPSHRHEIYGDDQLDKFMIISRRGSVFDWDSGHESHVSNWYYTSSSGGDQPHNVMQPYMALHYIMRVR